MGTGLVAKNHLQPPKAIFLPQIILKFTVLKLQILFVRFKISYLIRISFVSQSYVCAYHVYVTRMYSYFVYKYSYAIRMSLLCAFMSSVCHSHVLVCNGMSLVCSRMSLVYTLMPLVCTLVLSVCHSYVICMSLVRTRMSSVCHSYVLLFHPYVTRMYLYVICMSFVCGFTMNHGFHLSSSNSSKK